MTTTPPEQGATRPPSPPCHTPTRSVSTMNPQHYGTGQGAGFMAEPKRDRRTTDKPKVANRGRIGPYMTAEEAGRVRGAYQHGWLVEEGNTGSFSDFLKAVILGAVDLLEKEYNGGEPWPDVPACAIRVVTHRQIADKRMAAAEDE